MRKAFDTNPAKCLLDGDKIKFNGAITSQHTRTLLLIQPYHTKKLKELNINNLTTSDFVAEQARGA